MSLIVKKKLHDSFVIIISLFFQLQESKHPEHEETTSSTADKSKDSKTEETEKHYNARSTTESKTSQVIMIYSET